MDNNFNSKNAYAKAGSSIHYIISANTNRNVCASNINNIKDADGNNNADNNTDNKNIYTKADFNTYNIADTNADMSIGANNTSGISEKISNTINNIDIN